GFLYKVLMSGFKVWSSEPGYKLEWYKGTHVSGELAPELLGVGYIIGPRTAGIMMGGGVLSTLVLIPLIKMFGEHLKEPLFPGTTLISAMETHDIWKSYVLYIGAGAVAAGGIISLFSSLPLIFSAFRAGLKDFSIGGSPTQAQTPRTDRDLPLTVVVGGTLLLVALVWLSPMLNVTLPGAVLIVMFGFLFVTVSSRLVGEIGSSSNPISGMTVSTLLITCLIFLFMGWTGAEYRLTALSIAAVVCIAASNGGTCSQDLKTGFLVGATPKWQQISILIGALTSAVVIGGTLLALNSASTVYVRPQAGLKFRADVSKLTKKESVRGPEAVRDTRVYSVLYLNEANDELPAGKYLINDDGSIAWIIDPGINGTAKFHECNRQFQKIEDPAAQAFALPAEKLAELEVVNAEVASSGGLPLDQTYRTLLLDKKTDGVEAGKYLVDGTGKLRFKVDQGPEVTKYDSPKAKLMSLIIDGILTQKLPWILVIIGAFIAVLLELCQVSSLPFAVGVYLPFSASVPIFIGGMVRWLVDATSKKLSDAESESSPGVLVSSGLIAGGSIAGIALALMALYENALAKLDCSKLLTEATSSLVSAVLFVLMALFLYA
ncbi:MAG TPA: OPT/YSL family transporter, partial [Candidatus Ozemobacteraceae bacterium]|nr:OPT/YSL family transporter [Candidatus Ozemobacteraceae bacterium]